MTTTTADSPARDIVFIDSRVQDTATLLQGLQPGTEVVFLQAGQDGLVQMAAALGERGDVGTVQVIAHGSAGQLWLGSRFLDNAALQQPEVQAQLAALGRGLTAEGDLLIYACDTAQGSAGAQFVSTLAALAGADVAASDDRTGAGSDWDLEITTGHIAAPVALSQDSLAAYDQALATFTVINSNSSGAGSLLQAITDAKNAAGPDTIEFAPNLSGSTISLSAQQLNINSDLQIRGDIDGNGTPDITIRTSGAGRVLNITAGTVVLDGLSITNSSLTGKAGSNGTGNPGADALGAGIFVTGAGTEVTILHSSITGNTAKGGAGAENYSGNGGNGGHAVGGLYIGSGATVQMATTSVTGNSGTGGNGGYGNNIGGNGGNGTGGVLVASGGTFRYESSSVNISSNNGTRGTGGSSLAASLGTNGASTANISGAADNTWIYTPPAPTVTLTVNSASVAEAAGTATLTATLSAVAAADTTVTIGRQSGSTATLTDDFTLSSTTITITAGQTTGTATLTAVQDALHEGDETAIIEITGVTGGGGATESGAQQQTVTITDDDPTPSLSISNVSQTEGNSGISNLTFTVTLSAASAQAVSVGYATSDGTATAGSDYTASSGTLTFAAGETSKTFTVAVAGDTTAEPNETFMVALSNPVNATLATASATGTILDDDSDVIAPSVSSITRVESAFTNATSVHYTVTFSEAVTGVDTSDFTLTGTGAAGTVDAVTGSGSTYTVTVNSITGDGPLRLDLKASGTGITDGASNPIAGGFTSGQSYTFDHIAPSAPTSPDLTAGTDTGSSSSDNLTSNATPTFTGTAEAGSTVKLYDTDGTSLLGTGIATGGTWSITSSALAAGTHTVTATATDAVGNVSAASVGLQLTIDTTAPTLAITSNVSALKVGETATITFTFSEDPGATFTWDGSSGDVVVTGGTLGALSGTGLVRTATFTPAANTNAGTATITVAAASYTDAAGNSGGVGNTPSLSFDTLAPAAPSAPVLRFTSDTGVSNVDGITNATTPTFTGTAAAGSTVTLYDTDGGTALGSTVATGGVWSITSSALAQGAHTLTAKATDAVGNVSAASTPLTVTIDTTAPAITFSGVALSLDTGASSTDLITNTAAQTIIATLSAAPAVGDIVYGSLDNGATWTDITSKVSGTTLTWNGVTLAASNTLQLRVSDVAGNNGAATSAAYVLDTAGPTTSVATVAFSADTGASSTDLVTKTAAQTVSGTLSANLAAGESVLVSLDNGATWTTATSTVGSDAWSLGGQTLSASDTLQVKVSDTAGNDGAVLSQAYVYDTAATVPTVATLSSLSLTPVLTGAATLAAGETMTVTVGGATYDVVPVAGAWSLDLAAAVPASGTLTLALNHHYEVVATVTDLAGNVASDTTAGELVLGTLPTPPRPDPDPVTPTPPTPGVPDNDGIPGPVEDQAPGIPGPGGSTPVPGDGNGDGIKDSEQSAVASIGFVLSPTGESNPGSAPPTFTTLVASSIDGKVTGDPSNSRITSLSQQDAPSHLPEGMQMPIGLVSFTVALGAGKTGENFSLYVDPALEANGYWKQDNTGTWVNIASEPYGGKMVMEGGRVRLDFHIEDGGQFDADGKVDGIITDPGAPAHMALSIVGMAPDIGHNPFWF